VALRVTTWRWGSKYPQFYVDRLAAGLRRHLAQPYDFRVIVPQDEDAALTAIPGCLARLRAFDPAWQAAQGFEAGDRIVCLDLDLVITGPLDALFDRPENFVILQGANASNPCPYNGSVWMLRAGHYPHVWQDFSLDALRITNYFEFPDDQGWFAHTLPGAAGWQVGPSSGLYAYKKPMWPKGDALPKDARIVAFPGWRDPSAFEHLDWVKEHWRA
jgi:hypothetical protein